MFLVRFGPEWAEFAIDLVFEAKKAVVS